jgi:CHAT domain-containing protein
MLDQGRYAEAELLNIEALELVRRLEFPADSQVNAQVLSELAASLSLQNKETEALERYSELDRATAGWQAARRQAIELSPARIFLLVAGNNLEAGIAAATSLVKLETARVGAGHYATALARGALAIGLARAGREAEALGEFKASVPVLIGSARETAANDDAAALAVSTERMRDVVEAFVALTVKRGQAAQAAIDTFPLSDVLRGQSVQRALVSAAARMSSANAPLGAKVREEQDLEKQINARLAHLTAVLAVPSEEGDGNVVLQLNQAIERLRAARVAARKELSTRFPEYVELTSPRPPSAEEMRKALRADEAIISFFFGRSDSFAWVIPKEGPPTVRALGIPALQIERMIADLRRALEPDVRSIADIPPFNIALAHRLYEILLKPLEQSWKEAKHLLIATNGALGLLPLSLLPTEKMDVKVDTDPWFSGYRGVRWLARTHSVTVIPSVVSLRTLRSLPPPAKAREPFIAFGDPYFSAEQAAAAQEEQSASVASDVVQLRRRSTPSADRVTSADLAKLPRLPDTADELHAVAQALGVDGAKSLRLGKNANEAAVRAEALSRFSIVGFATHGLLPGDLNGLHEPALALTAPEVAGVEGDGLLTMTEIMTLKLDADWVILSACNTGSGTSSSAEALSGLGRAFFYAGTRALLTTNWSVDSPSARELVADIFARLAHTTSLNRSEALRQSMLNLIDHGGYVQDGTMAYSYAHPLFWAPYSVVGDGGSLQN